MHGMLWVNLAFPPFPTMSEAASQVIQSTQITQTDKAFHALRMAILRCDFLPGARLAWKS